MVESVEVITISVNHPELITFYQLGFDHTDDFSAWPSGVINKFNGIAKSIAGTYFGHGNADS